MKQQQDKKPTPTKGVKDRVINIRSKNINIAAIERIKTQIVDNPQVGDVTRQAGQELIASQLKSYIANTKPELYKAFKANLRQTNDKSQKHTVGMSWGFRCNVATKKSP